MKKNILFALPLSALVIACAQQGTDQMAGCQTMEIPTACNGPPDKPKININVQSGLTVAPKNVCANADTDIKVKVTPPNTKVTVVTVPKKPENTWMTGINKPDSEFDITVPASASVGDEFNYYIVATNGKCYDPKITVR